MIIYNIHSHLEWVSPWFHPRLQFTVPKPKVGGVYCGGVLQGVLCIGKRGRSAEEVVDRQPCLHRRCDLIERPRMGGECRMGYKHGFAVFLALLIAAARLAEGGGWEIVHRQSEGSAGSSTQPSIRYGHAMLAHQGQTLITHGYFFDRESGQATWKSDTWSLQMEPPYAFQQLSPGISQDKAFNAYNTHTLPEAPSGRFGTGGGARNGSFYLYGGHDGGYSRHGRQNYEPGYDFDELWRFDTTSNSWASLPATGTAVPGKRYLLASTVLGDHLLVYGGIQEGQGDVWSLDLVTLIWERLSPEVPSNAGGPGRRVGHDIVPVISPGKGPRGFVLYGGRLITSTESVLVNDAWFFDIGSRAWRKLAYTTESPSPRKYHAMTHTYLQVGDGSCCRAWREGLIGAGGCSGAWGWAWGAGTRGWWQRAWAGGWGHGCGQRLVAGGMGKRLVAGGRGYGQGGKAAWLGSWAGGWGRGAGAGGRGHGQRQGMGGQGRQHGWGPRGRWQ